ARFPATLPAASGVNLTALNASNLGSGTVPDARFPATLPTANAVNLTNYLEKNIVSTTNTWGSQVVDFSSDRMILTNLAGDLTITGISGFVNSNYNWITIDLNPNGATRVLTVPADWYVSGFSNE